MNLRYTKNIEGSFGFYMNDGLVKPDYVAETFKSLVYKNNELEQQLKEAKNVIEQCLYHTSMRDPDVNTHKQASDTVENITKEYLAKYKVKSDK